MVVLGEGRFLMSEVPLYTRLHEVPLYTRLHPYQAESSESMSLKYDESSECMRLKYDGLVFKAHGLVYRTQGS